jgi:hypothetical protein
LASTWLFDNLLKSITACAGSAATVGVASNGSAYARSSSAWHSATVTAQVPAEANFFCCVWCSNAACGLVSEPRATDRKPSSFFVGLHAWLLGLPSRKKLG